MKCFEPNGQFDLQCPQTNHRPFCKAMVNKDSENMDLFVFQKAVIYLVVG